MSLHHPTLAVTLLLGLLLASAAAPVAAGGYSAGSIVQKGDYDYVAWPKAQNGKVSLCFVDDDGSGTYMAGEPLFLDISSATCAGNVEPKDIRLTESAAGKAGKAVKGSDDDAYRPFMGPLVHFIRFYDVAGTAKMAKDSVVYLDIMNTPNLKVDVGDLRVTADGDLPRLTPVKSGDADLNHALNDLIAGGKALTDAEMVYTAGGAYYINTGTKVINTAKFGIEANDVRLDDKGTSLDVPALGTPELTVTELTLGSAVVRANAPFQVRIALKNEATVLGAGLVELFMGGALVDARGSPTLAPGATTALVATLFAPATGSVTLRSGDAELLITVSSGSAGSITGAAVPPNVRSDPDPPGEPVAGRQAAAAGTDAFQWVVLAGVGIVAFARRRL